jgi:Kef-type K+ transport system membrane component KefB
MLFNGVSFSITAFPVLCRILSDLKLLDTTVGVVTLSAGVCNDIVGWVLLALAVALVNASSGLTALWVILCTLGFAAFLIFPVRLALQWFARLSNSLDGNPSMFFMTVTMMIVFGSAFFTDIIGVHAIFGGFLAGLAVPRRGGLAIAMVERLEDMVAIIFLPLVSNVTASVHMSSSSLYSHILIVFYPVRALDRFGSAEYGNIMGFHIFVDRLGLDGEVHRRHSWGKIIRLQAS